MALAGAFSMTWHRAWRGFFFKICCFIIAMTSILILTVQNKWQQDQSRGYNVIGNDGLLIEAQFPNTFEQQDRDLILNQLIQTVKSIEKIDYVKLYTHKQVKKKFFHSVEHVPFKVEDAYFIFVQFSYANKVDWQLLMQDLQAIAKDTKLSPFVTNAYEQKGKYFYRSLFLWIGWIMLLLSIGYVLVEHFFSFNKIAIRTLYQLGAERFVCVKLIGPCFLLYSACLCLIAGLICQLYLYMPGGTYVQTYFFQGFKDTALYSVMAFIYLNLVIMLFVIFSLKRVEKDFIYQVGV